MWRETAYAASGYEEIAKREVQDGVILHCWNWSYNNMKANMKAIADAGYTAIQTSPIQQSKDATKGSPYVGNWWRYYQPMGFHIDDTGNSALGTKSEFISMCAEAEKYGIKVIVDVVAKHIETPDDHPSFASDFWPNVIGSINAYADAKGADLYIYGEVLDSPGGKILNLGIDSYLKYMNVTDNSWGNTVTSNFKDGYGISPFYHKDAAADRLVLWAECHDTFANDDGFTKNFDSSLIHKSWAIVSARKDATALYLSRPESSSSKLGDANPTGWNNKEVVAANQFHNQFVGQAEYVANENGITCVERGNSGVVLTNVSGYSTYANVTNHMLSDGVYMDQITGNTFVVSGGRIQGQIGSTGIAVVTKAVTQSTAYISVPSDWNTPVYCYAYDLASGKNQNAAWPGVEMTKVSDGIYKYEVPTTILNPGVIFTDGSKQYPEVGNGLYIAGNMIYKDGAWTTYTPGESKPQTPSDGSGNESQTPSDESGSSSTEGGSSTESGSTEGGSSTESGSTESGSTESGSTEESSSSAEDIYMNFDNGISKSSTVKSTEHGKLSSKKSSFAESTTGYSGNGVKISKPDGSKEFEYHIGFQNANKAGKLQFKILVKDDSKVSEITSVSVNGQKISGSKSLTKGSWTTIDAGEIGAESGYITIKGKATSSSKYYFYMDDVIISK